MNNTKQRVETLFYEVSQEIDEEANIIFLIKNPKILDHLESNVNLVEEAYSVYIANKVWECDCPFTDALIEQYLNYLLIDKKVRVLLDFADDKNLYVTYDEEDESLVIQGEILSVLHENFPDYNIKVTNVY